MGKKGIFYVIIYGFILGGCSSVPVDTSSGGNTEQFELISANTAAVERSKAAIGGITDIIDRNAIRLENIREQAGGITDGIERLERLFDEYDAEFEQVKRELEALRARLAEGTGTTGAGAQDSKGTDNNPSD